MLHFHDQQVWQVLGASSGDSFIWKIKGLTPGSWLLMLHQSNSESTCLEGEFTCSCGTAVAQDTIKLGHVVLVVSGAQKGLCSNGREAVD